MNKSQRSVIVVLIVVLALAVFVAVLVEKSLREPGVSTVTSLSNQGVLQEELFIKGCLFNLGISEADTRVSGNTITVYTKTELSRSKIHNAFSPLRETARVGIKNTGHTRIIFSDSTWDIFFHRAMKRTAQIAIIVDDMGRSMDSVRQLGSLEADLTFSVLPLQPHSQDVANHLHGLGKEVMLHLPMQGNGKDPGPNAIYADMSHSEIIENLKDNIRSIPHISGVNNHMGSVVTKDYTLMKYVFDELKESGLFFIDSLTTPESICRKAAVDIGIPFDVRDVFLDNQRSDAYIKTQLDKLITISLKHSEAIGICHPYPETIAVLEREIPRLKDLGVEIVRVSAFVD
jgi:polysaccharide deacetylase 2 family uncharacterized protein YibQ